MVDILWTEAAKDDLLEFVDYLSDEKPQAARDFVDTLEHITETLSEFPQIGHSLEAVLPVRQVLVGSARLIYIEHESHITIIACVHQARDCQSLLRNRARR